MNSKPVFSKSAFLIISSVLGVLLMPLIWVFLKTCVGIGDRYLPSIPAVFQAAADLRPSIFAHTLYSLSRLAIGFTLDVVAGVALGIGTYRSPIFKNLGMPTIQALRSVPPIATVTFDPGQRLWQHGAILCSEIQNCFDFTTGLLTALKYHVAMAKNREKIIG